MGQQSGFSEEYYDSSDGLKLYARIYGDPKATRTIVCLPGLTRNSRDFHDLAVQLTDRDSSCRVITLDSRGRGLSGWDDNKQNYNLVVEAGDVLTACAAFGVTKASFIGTSRGGLILHLLIAMRPELIESVVLNDVGPELGIEGLRHIQSYLTSPRPAPKDWEEATAYVRDNHGAEFTALSADDFRDMAAAIYREVDGMIRPDVDPAIARQFADLDLSKPPSDLWPQFDKFAGLPVMVVKGENSKLLTEGIVARMAEKHAGLTVVIAEGQGHAPVLHLDGIGAAIGDFFSRG